MASSIDLSAGIRPLQRSIRGRPHRLCGLRPDEWDALVSHAAGVDMNDFTLAVQTAEVLAAEPTELLVEYCEAWWLARRREEDARGGRNVG